jgi:hypothetical protein
VRVLAVLGSLVDEVTALRRLVLDRLSRRSVDVERTDDGDERRGRLIRLRCSGRRFEVGGSIDYGQR